MIVNFDLATLTEGVIALLVQAAGGRGWLAGEFQDEQGRRERIARGESAEVARPLILPTLDPPSLRAEYLECGRCLIGIEARQAELMETNPLAAAELEPAAHLFYEIMQSLKRAAQLPSMVN